MNEVDAYIAAFPSDVQARLTAIRNIIHEEVRQATERICMRMPTFDLNGKWFVHFAAFPKHIGFYPQPEGILPFKEKLAAYRTSKGSIRFWNLDRRKEFFRMSCRLSLIGPEVACRIVFNNRWFACFA